MSPRSLCPPFRRVVLLLALGLTLLGACSGAAPPEASATLSASATHPASVTLPPAPQMSATLPPSANRTPVPPPTLTGTPIPPVAVCSPLEGFAPGDLAEAVVNPYHPPPLGSDDPHQGVDLAYRAGDPPIALAGQPVYAVLPGEVALVITERDPYGNALLVETPLERSSPSWLAGLHLPAPIPTLPPHPSLTCPALPSPPEWRVEPRSLYLLYAHLQAPPGLQVGESLACGQAIGLTGDSGNALNPHLHLEARVGPAGVRFDGLAHYETRATPAEMANYCLWRVSGWFQAIDPLLVFAAPAE